MYPNVHCSTIYNSQDMDISNLNAHWQMNGQEVVVPIHTGILLCYKRDAFESVLMRWMNLESIIQSEVVGKKKTNTVYQCIYMEFRKMVPTILHAGQQRRHRCKEQTFGLSERRRGWDDLREQYRNKCITTCKRDIQSEFDV